MTWAGSARFGGSRAFLEEMASIHAGSGGILDEERMTASAVPASQEVSRVLSPSSPRPPQLAPLGAGGGGRRGGTRRGWAICLHPLHRGLGARAAEPVRPVEL